MDTFQVFQAGNRARKMGAQVKIFDWAKAKNLIEQYNIQNVWAGLAEDWEWTSDKILVNGKWIENHGAYLSSVWATPVFISEEIKVDCWVYDVEKLT